MQVVSRKLTRHYHLQSSRQYQEFHWLDLLKTLHPLKLSHWKWTWIWNQNGWNDQFLNVDLEFGRESDAGRMGMTEISMHSWTLSEHMCQTGRTTFVPANSWKDDIYLDKNDSMDSMEHFVTYDNYLIVLKYLEQDISIGGSKELTRNRVALLSRNPNESDLLSSVIARPLWKLQKVYQIR